MTQPIHPTQVKTDHLYQPIEDRPAPKRTKRQLAKFINSILEAKSFHDGPCEVVWKGEGVGYSEIIPLRHFFDMHGLCKVVGIVPYSNPAVWIVAVYDATADEMKVIAHSEGNEPSALILGHLTCGSVMSEQLEQLIYG